MVRALDAGHPLEGGDAIEQGLHGGLDRGIVDALLGLEDDRAHLARALTLELGVEDVETLRRLLAGQREVLAVVVADAARDAVGDDEQRDPQDEHETAPVVAPRSEAGEHASSLGGWYVESCE